MSSWNTSQPGPAAARTLHSLDWVPGKTAPLLIRSPPDIMTRWRGFSLLPCRSGFFGSTAGVWGRLGKGHATMTYSQKKTLQRNMALNNSHLLNTCSTSDTSFQGTTVLLRTLRQRSKFSPPHRGEYWGTGRLGKLLQVTQDAMERARFKLYPSGSSLQYPMLLNSPRCYTAQVRRWVRSWRHSCPSQVKMN